VALNTANGAVNGNANMRRLTKNQLHPLLFNARRPPPRRPSPLPTSLVPTTLSPLPSPPPQYFVTHESTATTACVTRRPVPPLPGCFLPIILAQHLTAAEARGACCSRTTCRTSPAHIGIGNSARTCNYKYGRIAIALHPLQYCVFIAASIFDRSSACKAPAAAARALSKKASAICPHAVGRHAGDLRPVKGDRSGDEGVMRHGA